MVNLDELRHDVAQLKGNFASWNGFTAGLDAYLAKLDSLGDASVINEYNELVADYSQAVSEQGKLESMRALISYYHKHESDLASQSNVTADIKYLENRLGDYEEKLELERQLQNSPSVQTAKKVANRLLTVYHKLGVDTTRLESYLEQADKVASKNSVIAEYNRLRGIQIKAKGIKRILSTTQDLVDYTNNHEKDLPAKVVARIRVIESEVNDLRQAYSDLERFNAKVDEYNAQNR